MSDATRKPLPVPDGIQGAQIWGHSLLKTINTVASSDANEAELRASVFSLSRLAQSVMDDLDAGVDELHNQAGLQDASSAVDQAGADHRQQLADHASALEIATGGDSPPADNLMSVDEIAFYRGRSVIQTVIAGLHEASGVDPTDYAIALESAVKELDRSSRAGTLNGSPPASTDKAGRSALLAMEEPLNQARGQAFALYGALGEFAGSDPLVYAGQALVKSLQDVYEVWDAAIHKD